MKTKTSFKRTQTRTAGIFYKAIISETEKVVDKVSGIRYPDENGEARLKSIGK